MRRRTSAVAVAGALFGAILTPVALLAQQWREHRPRPAVALCDCTLCRR